MKINLNSGYNNVKKKKSNVNYYNDLKKKKYY